ncbi:MAG TPA: tetratricopeptide repeat protein, partial [Dehalococcoidia bacterium]|nr:tetratricopeptide repeat protein [Dehalococcoidia bacterium]
MAASLGALSSSWGPAPPPGTQAAGFDLATARALAREGRFDAAAFVYALAALSGPPAERAQAWFERAGTLRVLGRYDAALRSLDRAAPAGGPLAVDALWLRAVIQRDSGDDAGALASLDAYVAAGGGHPAARALRAELLAATGRPAEAANEARPLLDSLPETSAVRLLLALARGFDRAGDSVSALAWYR